MISLARATGISFADAIKVMRLERNVSARSLSLDCGLSSSYVSKMESGTKPTVEAFMKIARSLDLSDYEILFLLGCE